MIYACMYTNIRVQVCMCTYAIRKGYSPISEKSRYHVHVCTCVHVCSQGLAMDCKRQLWRGILERENAKKREKSREKIKVLILKERKREFVCGIGGGGGGAEGKVRKVAGLIQDERGERYLEKSKGGERKYCFGPS